MTKLVQPNVLRAYQSGEQYAINELVLYNSVPAYTNTALAQGVAGTAGNFTNIGSNTFSDSLFRIQDNADATKQIAFEASSVATATTRTITVPDANVDLGSISTSSIAGATFVYTAGMGSVVKTITTNDTTFNVDALEQNRAHSVIIRNGDSSYPYNTPHTFQFVSAKVGTASGFADAQGFGLQDATYINSLSTLTITLQPNESMEVRYIGSGGGLTSIFSMQRNLVGLVAIPASTSDFTLYHERRHSLPHAYADVLNLKLPITYRVGTSITLEDVVGTSASTITAINITPTGSQTVQSLSTVDIKTLIDNGCTVKLVFFGSNNWVLNVQYSKVVRGNTLGVRNTAGALTSFDVSAATVNRTITLPNADVDLGKIPAVATPYTTAPMAGTRPQCLGGSSNTFSGGTDVVAVGCTGCTFTGSNIVAYGCNGLVLPTNNVLNSTLSLRNNYVLGTDNVSPVTFGLAGYTVEGVTLEGWANYSTFRAWGKGYKVVGYKQYADTNAHGTGYITGTIASTTEATVALFAKTVGNAEGTLTLVDEYRLPITAVPFSQQTAVHELTLQGYDILNGRKFIGSRRIVVTETGGTATVHPLQTIGTDIIVGSAFTVTIVATNGGLAGQSQTWQNGLVIRVSNSLTTGATYWTATLKTTLFATAVGTNF